MFCFHLGLLLAIRHEERGVDIPGGHLEPGESPLQALAREVLEEACATITDVRELGAVVVEQVDPFRVSRYPPVSQMLMFSSQLDRALPFDGASETRERLFIPLMELPRLHENWNPVFQAVLDLCASDRGIKHA